MAPGGRQPVSKTGPCHAHEGSTPSPSATECAPVGEQAYPLRSDRRFCGFDSHPGYQRGRGVNREHGSLPSSRYEFESRRPLQFFDNSIRLLLSGRPTAGHVALNHEIGVRILAGHPEELWRKWSARRSEEPEEVVRFHRAPPNSEEELG